MRRRLRTGLLAAAALGALLAGCGAEEFPNDPRPPAPIQLSAKIGPEQLTLSPKRVGGEPIGAGIANVTISNQTPDEVSLAVEGPTERSTGAIVPHGEDQLKLNLLEGEYVLRASDPGIRPVVFAVGPERPTASNDLLLP
jgi:hypothetical protein